MPQRRYSPASKCRKDVILRHGTSHVECVPENLVLRYGTILYCKFCPTNYSNRRAFVELNKSKFHYRKRRRPSWQCTSTSTTKRLVLQKQPTTTNKQTSGTDNNRQPTTANANNNTAAFRRVATSSTSQ